ncbi:MAG: type IV toxin-antitoxin system AbiEi family antitoxin domain-containing protein, partial [Gammaproteobacteria bacterium]
VSTSLATIYSIAERQGGYFTTSQAHVAGVSDQQLHYLVKSGSIERAAHGIYRLQRFPAQRFEDVIVASLWAGEGAVASHETALAVYGLTEAMPRVIHVTVPRRFRGKRKGVVVHTAHLREDERTIREGVPVTSPARTIRDIAVRYGPSEAAEAGREAIARGIITRRRLTRELANDAEARSVLDLLDPGS